MASRRSHATAISEKMDACTAERLSPTLTRQPLRVVSLACVTSVAMDAPPTMMSAQQSEAMRRRSGRRQWRWAVRRTRTAKLVRRMSGVRGRRA